MRRVWNVYELNIITNGALKTHYTDVPTELPYFTFGVEYRRLFRHSSHASIFGLSGDVVLPLRVLSSSSDDSVLTLDRRFESVSSLGSCSFEWNSESLRRRSAAPKPEVSPAKTGEDRVLDTLVLSRGKLLAFAGGVDGFCATGIGFESLIVVRVSAQAGRPDNYSYIIISLVIQVMYNHICCIQLLKLRNPGK